MSNYKNIVESVLFIIGILLIQISAVWYYWLYTNTVEFGSVEFAVLNMYFYILVPAFMFALGVVFVAWRIQSKWIKVAYPRIVNGVLSFVGILSVIMILSVWVGLPFDASYSWGTNAVMFSKAFVAILPAVLCVITIVAILIATSGNFFLMLFKCVVIVAITAVVYYFVVPLIMQYL